jgi:CBS domain containing-hemolysin-like protein
MTDEGSLDTERGDLVSSALQFAEVTAGTVLTSRVDLAAVNVDWGEEELMAFIKEQRHSRLRCTRARWTISSACSRSANT